MAGEGSMYTAHSNDLLSCAWKDIQTMDSFEKAVKSYIFFSLGDTVLLIRTLTPTKWRYSTETLHGQETSEGDYL